MYLPSKAFLLYCNKKAFISPNHINCPGRAGIFQMSWPGRLTSRRARPGRCGWRRCRRDAGPARRRESRKPGASAASRDHMRYTCNPSELLPLGGGDVRRLGGGGRRAGPRPVCGPLLGGLPDASLAASHRSAARAKGAGESRAVGSAASNAREFAAGGSAGIARRPPPTSHAADPTVRPPAAAEERRLAAPPRRHRGAPA